MSVTLESVSQKEYDFIIVGAGAGAGVAARLAENPNFSVLLIEAGKKEAPSDHTTVPLLGVHASTHPEFNWQYALLPQKGLNDRLIPYPRGKAIGGTSFTNILFALRGPSSDWDRIAQETGDDRWSWDNILPFAKKLETFVPPTNGWDYKTDFDTTSSGVDGPIRIGIANTPTKGTQIVIQAAKNEGIFNSNVNDGNMLGVGWLPGTMGGGFRSTAADYLANPKPNLDILTGAQVTKVLFSEGEEPTATGVEYAANATSPRLQVKAKKEVILAGGTIGSPHILLLSGIGDAAELKSFGIPVVKDLPEVGKNLHDHHLMFGPHFSIHNKETFDTLLQDPDAAQAAAIQYGTSFSGPLSNMIAQAVGFWRIPEDAPIWSEVKDSSSGPAAPHIEVLFGDGYAHALPPPTPGNYFSCSHLNLTPNSRGTITLTSADPFAFPAIDPNLIGSKHDMYIAVEAVKQCRRYVSKPEFKDYIIEEYGVLAKHQTDAEIEAYIRNAAISCWHPTGTTRMTAKGSSEGVLDPDLKVKGVKGLRVVDASVFPHVPTGHTQLPVYIVAERAADMIATEHAT